MSHDFEYDLIKHEVNHFLYITMNQSQIRYSKKQLWMPPKKLVSCTHDCRGIFKWRRSCSNNKNINILDHTIESMKKNYHLNNRQEIEIMQLLMT